MAVTIRLSRAGRIHLPFYHIGVFDRRTRRDGRPVEYVGFYDPASPTKEPVRIDVERVRHWLSVGADVSATVKSLLKRQGVAVAADAAQVRLDKAKKEAAKPATAPKAAAPAKKAASKKKAPKKRTANSKAAAERKNKGPGA